LSETIDELPPRDEATGQFTAYEPPVLPPDNMEYTPLEQPIAEEDLAIPSIDEFIEATGDHGYLAEHEIPGGIALQLQDPATGEKKPDNVSVELETAGELLSQWEANVQTHVDMLNDSELRTEVDSALAEHSSEELKELGREEVKPVEQQGRPDTATKPDEEVPPGVDPDLHRAVSHPKVREFLEANLAQAEAARQQYLQAANSANQVHLSRLNEMLSQTNIGNLPTIEARMAAFEDLARTDPHLYVRAQAEMQSVMNAQAAQVQYQQQQAFAQQQQLEAYRTEQNRLFDQQVGKVSRADIDAVNDYVTDVLGLTPQEAGQLRNNPTALDHRFQRALLDAGRYHAMKNAPKAIPARERPPVQKPGAGPGPSAREVSLSRLEARLNQTGSETDGWALLQARMRG
jgi:hypothetical protein